ncbi:unnamed protein product [Blepharisma stoltei]|uniref:Uncharacterized protein n=1 Tax=Blepharisma stoltei TaxID=1481888 RepID=A0AAU9IFE4_9CILI|nr:unnamed protein product [Blepharisma stoltei]
MAEIWKGPAYDLRKQRKRVTIKGNSSPFELKTDNLPQIVKPCRSFKLLKKVKSSEKSFHNLCSIEEDFTLEREGDITSFLKEKSPTTPQINFTPKFDINGNLLQYSVIGPVKLFTTPKSNDSWTPIKPNQQSLNRTATNLNFSNRDNTNYQEKFKERLIEIENNSKLELSTDVKKASSMILYDRIRKGREERKLKQYDAIQNEWKLIEKGLSFKSKKKMQDLMPNRAFEYREKLEELEELDRNLPDKEESNSLSWYMSLRESQNQKFETYIPMGQKLLGLYTRISQKPKSPIEIIRKPGMVKTSSKTFRDWDYFLTKLGKEKSNSETIPSSQASHSDLLVIGLAKLPLEIDAVKNVGPEFLNPKLIPKPFKDEVFAEEYDPRNKTHKAV